MQRDSGSIKERTFAGGMIVEIKLRRSRWLIALRGRALRVP